MNKKVMMKQGPFEIRAAGENCTELLIFGDIGESFWTEGVGAKEVVETLQTIETEEILVRINSYGGSVSDGVAIYNALRRHSALVTVSIEGVAVSIASLIAMCGDTIEMSENALFMVHAPWTYAGGNSNDMRNAADMLDKYAEAMSSSYMSKTGMSRDEIMAFLTDGVDHWFTAQEAKDQGFVDVITDEIQIAASGFDLSRFKHVPAAAAAFNQQKPKPDVIKNKKEKADAKPQTTQETVMTEQEKKAAAAKAEQEKLAQASKDGAVKAKAEETERKTTIRAAFKPFIAQDGMQDLCNTCIDDSEISAQDASDKILAQLGKDSTPLGANARVDMGEDEKDKFIKGASASINARANLQKDDSANQYRGYSLLELARASLAMNGVDTTRMGKLEMVGAAFTHSTGDFGNLLANSANKAMLRGYEEAEETFQAWTTPGELPDFKAGSRVGMNDFASLREVKAGAEYKYVTVGERAESVILATYGELFGIDRQAIINDDLQAFTRIPQKMGSAAVRTIGDLVYAVLTSNPNMSDGVALFHANHGNLITPATGIFTAAVDAMRVAMAKQKAGGKSLNIRLGNLIVPTALEGVAKVVRDSQFEVGGTSTTKANTTPNSVAGTFEVISDARLDDASATAWYGAANAGMHDTIEVSYLDGNQSPMLEQQNGWSIDGVQYKVRMDAGVSALDYRTMAKNAGS